MSVCLFSLLFVLLFFPPQPTDPSRIPSRSRDHINGRNEHIGISGHFAIILLRGTHVRNNVWKNTVTSEREHDDIHRIRLREAKERKKKENKKEESKQRQTSDIRNG